MVALLRHEVNAQVRKDIVMKYAEQATTQTPLILPNLALLEQTLAGVPAIPGLGVFARDCAAN